MRNDKISSDKKGLLERKYIDYIKYKIFNQICFSKVFHTIKFLTAITNKLYCLIRKIFSGFDNTYNGFF